VGRRWTHAEDEEIEGQFLDGVLVREISVPGRTAAAIKKRVERLALDSSERPSDFRLHNGGRRPREEHVP
jgi:hypothetical protein